MILGSWQVISDTDRQLARLRQPLVPSGCHVDSRRSSKVRCCRNCSRARGWRMGVRERCMERSVQGAPRRSALLPTFFRTSRQRSVSRLFPYPRVLPLLGDLASSVPFRAAMQGRSCSAPQSPIARQPRLASSEFGRESAHQVPSAAGISCIRQIDYTVPGTTSNLLHLGTGQDRSRIVQIIRNPRLRNVPLPAGRRNEDSIRVLVCFPVSKITANRGVLEFPSGREPTM